MGVWLGPTEAAVDAASAGGMLAARQAHRGVALDLQHLPGLQFLSSRVRSTPGQAAPWGLTGGRKLECGLLVLI